MTSFHFHQNKGGLVLVVIFFFLEDVNLGYLKKNKKIILIVIFRKYFHPK